jgi:hypothetical protein
VRPAWGIRRATGPRLLQGGGAGGVEGAQPLDDGVGLGVGEVLGGVEVAADDAVGDGEAFVAVVRRGDVIDVLDVAGVGFEGFAEGVAVGDLPRRVGVGALDGSELRAVQGLGMVVRVPSA